MAMPLSCQPRIPEPALGISQKTGSVSAHTHSTERPTLANMEARRETKNHADFHSHCIEGSTFANVETLRGVMTSATARTVQMLARCAAKPRMRAGTMARTIVAIGRSQHGRVKGGRPHESIRLERRPC